MQESMESMDFPLHDAAKRGNIQFVTECIDNKVGKCVNGLHDKFVGWCFKEFWV